MTIRPAQEKMFERSKTSGSGSHTAFDKNHLAKASTIYMEWETTLF